MAFIRYYVPLDDTSELCYYIEYACDESPPLPPSPNVVQVLKEVLGDLHPTSTLTELTSGIFEIGPKMAFHTSWCSNALNILHKCGLCQITRIEKSYRIIGHEPEYDQMTEEHYASPLESFGLNVEPEPVYTVPVSDLAAFNEQHNLGWDDADIKYYSSLFPDREPTNVELIDIAQSNSEHSRHHFFSGIHVINGVEKEQTLFKMIKSTLQKDSNSVLSFCDNASAIQGYPITEIVPSDFTFASPFRKHTRTYHPTFTAETHNFPTGIAPFPGAATGVGGRVRDTIAIGRGGRFVAGTAGYCVADQQLLIQASNGASDYGNKLGEPIICGFTRYFDQEIGKQRWAWVKPIMFSGGVGMVADRDLKKEQAEPGLAIVRIGGPAYRIGVGGSTASSHHQANSNNLNAVQRGDPEMENRVCSVIRACIENSENPIISIHDQGAGGTANVTKEIVFPVGGDVDIRNITSGDPTLTTVEKWIAEYQEQVTILVHDRDLEQLQQISKRENVDAIVFGHTTNDGYIRVHDDSGTPVCLDLDKIFKTPQKVYTDRKVTHFRPPIKLPTASFTELLQDVFRMESVGSKRFLTNKVDRSVSGLIIQQQCVGPLFTPLANLALVAHSHFSKSGTATAIGEQPIKAFCDPKAMGKLAVIEMITNIMWVQSSKLEDIKCSVNWMWPAKLPGENVAIYDCMQALSNYMIDLGIGADGGKDSVSMYTTRNGTLVKSPRSVVVSGYVTVPDVICKVTPAARGGWLYHIPLDHRHSLGGSALSQAFYLEGGDIYLPSPQKLAALYNVIQYCLETNLITAGHDISDGGLITTLVEMAIGGNVGLDVFSLDSSNYIEYFFSETPGVVIEVNDHKRSTLEALLQQKGLEYHLVGVTQPKLNTVTISHDGDVLLDISLGVVRSWWEQISYDIESHQIPATLAKAEWSYLATGVPTTWLSDCPPISDHYTSIGMPPKMAVLSDEGSNGSRDMAAAFHAAGFEVWDVTMTDLLHEPRLLDSFRGIAFVGGFTYADVFGAGTGWAAQIRHHPGLAQAFQRFKERTDTFSFGICNGCQLMSHIGWVPKCKFQKNSSGRFESRVSTVRVANSPAIMLKDLDMTVFGVWIAHTEGRFVGNVPPECIAMQYVNNHYVPTEVYPLNPSGSAKGITGICSPDGRHLAMMPHPERCWQTRQLGWVPEWWESEYTPWFKMFTNAYEWCKK